MGPEKQPNTFSTDAKTPSRFTTIILDIMKDVMCIIHQYSRTADKVLFKLRRGGNSQAQPPTIKITEPAHSPKSSWSKSKTSTKTPMQTTVPARPTAQRQPTICHEEMTRRDMYEALEALGQALAPTDYAIIGGIACLLLGHTRETKDVDIIVPDGQAARIAEELSKSGKFGTEPMANGRRRVWFNASSRKHYNVDVLEPRDIGQTFPAGELDVIYIDKRPVLSPAKLLNFKILGWTDRMATMGYKKVNHARDILFLVDYMAKKGIQTNKEEIYHATEDFLVMFFGSYPEARAMFERIGLTRRGSSARSSVRSGRSGHSSTGNGNFETSSRFKVGGLLSA